MICGGAPPGSFQKVNQGTFVGAQDTCARLVITDPNPKWVMSVMPSARVMGDMLLLPTGEVLIINGAQQGTAGWGVAREPNLAPVLYNPTFNVFQVMSATTIPRLYHSTANVMPDGWVLVGGSNPNFGYTFTGALFPTELRIERYNPYYLNQAYNGRRPAIVTIGNTTPGYGADFTVTLAIPQAPNAVAFHLYAPPFTTHTFSQNQRMLVLASTAPVAAGNHYLSTVTTPPSAILAPSGYYLLTAINQGTPSPSAWIHVGWWISIRLLNNLLLLLLLLLLLETMAQRKIRRWRKIYICIRHTRDWSIPVKIISRLYYHHLLLPLLLILLLRRRKHKRFRECSWSICSSAKLHRSHLSRARQNQKQRDSSILGRSRRRV